MRICRISFSEVVGSSSVHGILFHIPLLLQEDEAADEYEYQQVEDDITNNPIFLAGPGKTDTGIDKA